MFKFIIINLCLCSVSSVVKQNQCIAYLLPFRPISRLALLVEFILVLDLPPFCSFIIADTVGLHLRACRGNDEKETNREER